MRTDDGITTLRLNEELERKAVRLAFPGYKLRSGDIIVIDTEMEGGVLGVSVQVQHDDGKWLARDYYSRAASQAFLRDLLGPDE